MFRYFRVDVLGKKTRLDTNLKLLERHGFIARKQDDILEGPLLDVLLDYDVLAPRILNGALADVLTREQAQRDQANTPAAHIPVAPTTPAADTN